jgi:hypothetical protein
MARYWVVTTMFKVNSFIAFAACGFLSSPATAVPFYQGPSICYQPNLTLIANKIERKKFGAELENIRKRLIAKRSVSFSQLRSLADAGDSLAAFAFAKRLAALGKPTLLSDALHYYSESALGGRKYAVRSILEIAARPDVVFKPTHLKHAERALNVLAMEGNAVAVDGLIRLYTVGNPFGAKPQEVAHLLERRVRKGDGEAAYRLAITLLNAGKPSPDTTAQVIRYLEIAVDKGSLGTRSSAANIIILLNAGQPVLTSGVKS